RQLLLDTHSSVPSRLFLSVPVQAATTPDVGVGDEDRDDEEDHLDEPEELHRVEVHGPRVEEDDLDVEDDEEHRDDVVLHREAAATDRLRGGLDAALVAVQLGPVVALGADHAAHHHGAHREQERNGCEHQDWDVEVHRYAFSHCYCFGSCSHPTCVTQPTFVNL